MLFNKKYCFKNLFFFFTPHEKIVIRTESLLWCIVTALLDIIRAPISLSDLLFDH